MLTFFPLYLSLNAYAVSISLSRHTSSQLRIASASSLVNSCVSQLSNNFPTLILIVCNYNLIVCNCNKEMSTLTIIGLTLTS